jgi:hypothetical protein
MGGRKGTKNLVATQGPFFIIILPLRPWALFLLFFCIQKN